MTPQLRPGWRKIKDEFVNATLGAVMWRDSRGWRWDLAGTSPLRWYRTANVAMVACERAAGKGAR